MPGEQILLDPTSEGTGTQLDITDSTLGYFLLEHDYPVPPDVVQRAGSADTEGERPGSSRPSNRMITVKVRCAQPAGGSPTIETIIAALREKVAKMRRDGGTYRRVRPDGSTTRTFDVLKDGDHKVHEPADKRYGTRKVADVTLEFECAPYARGPEAAATLTTGTTTPVLRAVTASVVPGEVDATARFVVTNPGAGGFARLRWGMRSRDYSSAATAILFYQAESCTLGAGTTSVADATASGGNRATKTLAASMAKVVNLTDPSQVGTYRVIVRAKATGAATLEARWKMSAQAPEVTNAADVATLDTNWRVFDLGEVTTRTPLRGALGWDLSIYGASAAGAAVHLDWIALLPVEVGGTADTTSSISSLSQGLEIGSTYVIYHKTSTRFGGPVDDWTDAVYEGDYLRLPHGRVAELLAVPSDDSSDSASLIFTLAGTLYITPRYLT